MRPMSFFLGAFAPKTPMQHVRAARPYVSSCRRICCHAGYDVDALSAHCDVIIRQIHIKRTIYETIRRHLYLQLVLHCTVLFSFTR